MDRLGVALLAGVLGGVGGALTVRFAIPPAPPAPASAPESGTSREVAEQLAEIRRLLDRPAAASLSTRPEPVPPARIVPGDASHAGADSGTAGRPLGALTAADLQSIAERAADAALDRRAQREEKDAAAKPPAPARMPLADIAREMGLSGAQESDLREAYRSRTDRYLKLLAGPDGDPEAVRRELSDAKGDPDQIEALKGKYIPRFLSKIGEVAAIEAETAGKVNKALGSKENVAKYKRFTPEENDPFGLEASVSVRTSDK
jgi:hypothetical protein